VGTHDLGTLLRATRWASFLTLGFSPPFLEKLICHACVAKAGELGPQAISDSVSSFEHEVPPFRTRDEHGAFGNLELLAQRGRDDHSALRADLDLDHRAVHQQIARYQLVIFFKRVL
jgi:hypothetical protein